MNDKNLHTDSQVLFRSIALWVDLCHTIKWFISYKNNFTNNECACSHSTLKNTLRLEATKNIKMPSTEYASILKTIYV